MVLGIYNPNHYKQPSARQASKIWLDDLSCPSSAIHIGECSHSEWGSHNCGHSEDVDIRCYYSM